MIVNGADAVSVRYIFLRLSRFEDTQGGNGYCLTLYIRVAESNIRIYRVHRAPSGSDEQHSPISVDETLPSSRYSRRQNSDEILRPDTYIGRIYPIFVRARVSQLSGNNLRAKYDIPLRDLHTKTHDTRRRVMHVRDYVLQAPDDHRPLLSRAPVNSGVTLGYRLKRTYIRLILQNSAENSQQRNELPISLSLPFSLFFFLFVSFHGDRGRKCT